MVPSRYQYLTRPTGLPFAPNNGRNGERAGSYAVDNAESLHGTINALEANLEPTAAGSAELALVKYNSTIAAVRALEQGYFHPLTGAGHLIVVQQSQAATEFHKFPILPAELREQIWKEAIPAGRTIYMRTNAYPPPLSLVVKCDNVVPAMLHTNSESRAIALKYLVPTLRPTLFTQGWIATYVNFSCDTLAGSLSTIRRLTLSNDPSYVAARAQVKWISCLMWLPPYSQINERVVAALILQTPLGSWPALQGWIFPDVLAGEVGKVKTGPDIHLAIAKPTSMAAAQSQIIETAYILLMLGEAARPKVHNSNDRIGIRITYH